MSSVVKTNQHFVYRELAMWISIVSDIELYVASREQFPKSGAMKQLLARNIGMKDADWLLGAVDSNLAMFECESTRLGLLVNIIQTTILRTRPYLVEDIRIAFGLVTSE